LRARRVWFWSKRWRRTPARNRGSYVTTGAARARVGVAVKLLETTDDGFPSARELSVLNNLEDALAVAFETKENAIHALTITTSGFREYVFYSKETVDLSAALSIVRAKFNSYELQSYAAEDADWRVYDEFG
jgi:Family of unknown function (DUF695)